MAILSFLSCSFVVAGEKETLKSVINYLKAQKKVLISDAQSKINFLNMQISQAENELKQLEHQKTKTKKPTKQKTEKDDNR